MWILSLRMYNALFITEINYCKGLRQMIREFLNRRSIDNEWEKYFKTITTEVRRKVRTV